MAFYWWARVFNCRQVPVEPSLLVTDCGRQRRIGSRFRQETPAPPQPTAPPPMTWPDTFNGGTEGVNTKTKLIKRQMCGRAGFHLLRHRILLN